jgi:hypothetical protein
MLCRVCSFAIRQNRNEYCHPAFLLKGKYVDMVIVITSNLEGGTLVIPADDCMLPPLDSEFRVPLRLCDRLDF